MLRKSIIALAAAATLGVTALASSPASAHWGGWGHGFHHGFFFHRSVAFHHPFVLGRPFFFRRHFFAGPVLIDDDYGCWRVRRVPTIWGWRWRRVWVCG